MCQAVAIVSIGLTEWQLLAVLLTCFGASTTSSAQFSKKGGHGGGDCGAGWCCMVGSYKITGGMSGSRLAMWSFTALLTRTRNAA